MEPLRVQYKDYAVWHNRLLGDEKKIEAAVNFWQDQMSGKLPIPNLPYENSRRDVSRRTSAEYRTVILEETMLDLKKVAKEHKASLFMVLLAAFNLLLFRLSGQEDILIATPAAARQHEDLKNIIGFFVNTIILKNRVNPRESFIDYLEKVQDRRKKY